MLKQLIAKYLRQGGDANNVIYFSMDDPKLTSVSVDDIVSTFQTQAQSKLLFLIDEIQHCDNWRRDLKALTDQYENFKFVISGSAATSINSPEHESGAGRFTNFYLPSLLFCEFLQFINRWPSAIPKDANALLDVMYQPTMLETLNNDFINYLRYGAFPEALFSEEVRDDLYQYLVDDVIDQTLFKLIMAGREIRTPQKMRDLFFYLVHHLGQEISLEKLTQSTSLSKATLERYFTDLENSFLISKLYRVDADFHYLKRQQTFKAYTTNPSVPSLINELNDINIGCVVENAIHTQFPQNQLTSSLDFARWKAGRKMIEIDFIRRDLQQRSIAIEVKWSDNISTNDLPGLSQLLTNQKNRSHKPDEAICLTKSRQFIEQLDGTPVNFIPCAIFCLAEGLKQAQPRRSNAT